MAMQLDNASVMVTSNSSIQDVLSTVNVTPEMIDRFGSERSARFGTIAANLNNNDRDSAYMKCRLYAAWKDGYKEEKNTVYKNISELAENCGESRANFGLYAKVGKVFFSGAPAVNGWVEKRYNTAALFELSVLPAELLKAIDDLLSADESKRISTTQARCIKEAYNKGVNKDVRKFKEIFIYNTVDTVTDENGESHETYTVYSPETFINRICYWKEYTKTATENATENADSNSNNDENASKSDKSGYSFYVVIRAGRMNIGRTYPDGDESKILNYLSDNGYKIISTEHKEKSVCRTCIKVDDTGIPIDIFVLRVSPHTVRDMDAFVNEYNNRIKSDMEAKGVAEYFRPYSPHEYVEAINHDSYADILNIIENN